MFLIFLFFVFVWSGVFFSFSVGSFFGLWGDRNTANFDFLVFWYSSCITAAVCVGCGAAAGARDVM